MRRAGSREVGSGCGSSRTCARPRDPSGPWFRAGRLGAIRGHPLDGCPLPLLRKRTDLLQPSAAPLPRATGDDARGGALPTRAARPRLARSARAPARHSPHGLCQGTPPGEDEPPAASTNPANQRFAKHLRRGTCSSTVRTLSRYKTFACRGQPQDLRGGERGTGPVDPHERPPELPSQRGPRDRHRHVDNTPVPLVNPER